MIKDEGIESVCPMDNEPSENGGKERREHERFNVDNVGIDCEMSSASRVRILNISNSGLLVMADKLINIGKSYGLKIGYKDKVLFVKVNAIWALLTDCVKETNGDVVPLYTAGMQFVDVLRGEVKEIIQLLEVTSGDTVPDAFEGILQGNAYS